MLHINSHSSTVVVSCVNNKKQSPWIVDKHHHIFGYELSIAKDNLDHPYWKPHPFFKWIRTNEAEIIMLSSLVACCPIFPVMGYKGKVFA